MARMTMLDAKNAEIRLCRAARLSLPLVSSLFWLAYPMQHTFAASGSVSVVLKEEQRQDGMITYDMQEGMVPKYVTDEVLVITARDDAVTIKDVIVNRGNCKIEKYALPKMLKFGETVDIVANCTPLEAVINTDKSSFAFEFAEPKE